METVLNRIDLIGQRAEDDKFVGDNPACRILAAQWIGEAQCHHLARVAKGALIICDRSERFFVDREWVVEPTVTEKLKAPDTSAGGPD